MARTLFSRLFGLSNLCENKVLEIKSVLQYMCMYVTSVTLAMSLLVKKQTGNFGASVLNTNYDVFYKKLVLQVGFVILLSSY